MFVEMRTYTLAPGTTAEYLRTYETEGMAVQKEILGNMVGYFSTEIGPLNQVIHMWGYSDLKDRSERRAALFQNHAWLAMLPKLRQHMVSQEAKILIPTGFSPIR